MHMFEYTSQVIARERETEIVRAAEQHRVMLERVAAIDAMNAQAPSSVRGSAPQGSGDPGAFVGALRRAVRNLRGHGPHGAVSVGRGTMAR